MTRGGLLQPPPVARCGTAAVALLQSLTVARAWHCGSHFGTQSCLDAVYNSQRTGAAQRLLAFARQRYTDADPVCDCLFIQGMTKRLFDLIEGLQTQADK